MLNQALKKDFRRIGELVGWRWEVVMSYEL